MSATATVKKGGQGCVGPNVHTATSAPTADNDGTVGYRVGDVIINTTTGIVYHCVSNATGAASWAVLSTPLLSTVVADPGASGAIPVTASGYCPIVTAAAESRTLAIPTFAGQTLLLNFKTDGGDCTITVAQAIDEYGTTSIVLNDAGDEVLLVGVYLGSALRWRVASNRGVDTVPSRGPLETLIADPGASGAIPVTKSGHVELVSAAAETRTLAAPSFNGQQLLISLKTDGGDVVLTVATTVNQSANNTVTFNDAGDAVLLVAKQNGSNLRWAVQMNDGAALSTV